MGQVGLLEDFGNIAMKTFLRVSTMILAMFSFVSVASAARLQVIGTPTVREVPSNFDPRPNTTAINTINNFINLGSGGSLDVLDDADTDALVFSGSAKTSSNGLAIDFQGAASVDITFTYFGKEAGFTNTALAMNGGTQTLFNTETSSIGDSHTLTFLNTGSIGPFFIPFIFSSSKDFQDPDPNPNNNESIANNGTATDVNGNPINNLELGFLQDLNGNLFTNGLGIVEGSTVAFFGDGFGDTDLDDLVIGIGITGVTVIPLPAPVTLLISALLGLGLVSRMKRRLV